MPNSSDSAKSTANAVAPKHKSSISNSSERSLVGGNKARKRKRKRSESDLESEFEDCDMQNAIEIERKLRQVAKKNSLSDEEMRKLLQKFVNNDHILALVTLKAEDEVARERREAADQRAIIITDTPSVAKLTRAKARELNKMPGITLPSLADAPQPDIATLINDDLHSDEDDEEYTFKDEDFISDEDPNTTASDMESNPRTPRHRAEGESPVKLSADGCFKIPSDRPLDAQADLRIATRTRSKLCLEQTTIEDIQSEFVPPDVEQFDAQDTEVAATDVDWMQFLNEISKPLNFLADDDDPINDPEYVAAEKIPMDAEELRDVNISKKELTELVAELFEGLVNEGVSLENVELESPQKCVTNNFDYQDLQTPPPSPGEEVSAIVNNNKLNNNNNIVEGTRQIHLNEAGSDTHNVSADKISSANLTQNEISFHPDVMSTPAPETARQILVPIANVNSPHQTSSDTGYEGKTITIPSTLLSHETELIAVPLRGQPNCFKLARVVATDDDQPSQQCVPELLKKLPHKNTLTDTRYTTPYEINYSWQYISIQKHVHAEYVNKFEYLRHMPSSNVTNEVIYSETVIGFTAHQNQLLQQQLRLHIQLTTQTFMQTYHHPIHWSKASKAKKIILELQEKAISNATFNAWNLQPAVALITQWEKDLTIDSEENTELMAFTHKEINLTNRNTRQISRFSPRVMDLMLNSCVFVYPQYLPRIPFSSKPCSYDVFAAAESQLIALGLEKHMERIRKKRERLSKRASPHLLACDRLSKDTVFGKTKRRIWDHIKALRKCDYYNPVKYYFEHDRAPPVDQELLPFDSNLVLPPKQHFHQLPLAWQEHIIKEKNKTRTTISKKRRKSRVATASEEASLSYLQFVREAVGDEIEFEDKLPNTAGGGPETENKTPASAVRKERRQNKSKQSAAAPKSVTININYVFGNNSEGCSSPKTTTPNVTIDSNSCSVDGIGVTTNNCSEEALDIAPITYHYDDRTQTVQPLVEFGPDITADVTQHKSGDVNGSISNDKRDEPSTSARLINQVRRATKRLYQKTRRQGCSRLKRALLYTGYTQRQRKSLLGHRKHQRLKKEHYLLLFTAYQRSLLSHEHRYRCAPAVIQRCYRHFRALELFTDLLIDLKMFCSRNVAPASTASVGGNSPNSLGKRTRSIVPIVAADDEAGPAGTRSKKSNRQEENFRHMLLPDSVEDANRKDAIYAFNYYEKVEEALKSSNRPEDCNTFNDILKSFDPRRDKVADLYHKLEQLLLPDHPDLAQVFLTFLLPAEAAEIGKFFEHFMVTNMATFLNKLNIYFNKQPAQIRKIYNCLNELAEDPKVTMKKLETKILPLLKGNPFLIEWFMQQFPDEAPPERLLPTPEYINLKEVLNNQSGEFVETVTDFVESPTTEQQQQGCQLRYINGRIYYGSKMTLPAKLSYMAASYHSSETDPSAETEINRGCIHGIRELGERRLEKATAATRAGCTSDDVEKFEHEDVSNALVIDTTATNSTVLEDGDSCSSIETCDDQTLHAHAVRLNPSYYGTSCYTVATSTPYQQSSSHHHHPTRKSSLNFGDVEGKISPRKNASFTSGLMLLSAANPATHSSSLNSASNVLSASTAAFGSASNNCAGTAQFREKRKSPTKKSKSPVAAAALRDRASALQPMVVIHSEHKSSTSSAIACAKKLKSLIDSESNDCDESDAKERLTIVAKTKATIKADSDKADTFLVTKEENSNDLEFLSPSTTDSSVTFSQKSFPAMVVDMKSTEEDCNHQPQKVVSSPCVSSDEDCKLDVVESLAANSSKQASTLTATAPPDCSESAVTAPPPEPWTRDEDKSILIEMHLGSQNRDDLFQRIQSKLPSRSIHEIEARCQLLMDCFSKLHVK